MITGSTRNAKMKPKLVVAVRSPKRKFIPSSPKAMTCATPSDIKSKVFLPKGRYKTKAPNMNCSAKAPITVLNLIAFLFLDNKIAIPIRTNIPTKLIIIPIS